MTVELQGTGAYAALAGSVITVELYTGLTTATRTLAGQWQAYADSNGTWSVGDLPSCVGPYAGYYYEVSIPQSAGVTVKRGAVLDGVWAMPSLVDPGVTGPGGGAIDVTNAELGTGTADSGHLLRGDRAWAAYGTPGGSAVGDASAAGTAITPVRSDHVHGREAFATPGASAVGDVAGAGTATTIPHSDHVHGREAFGAVAAATTFGIASANGTATTTSHSDHTHGTPANPVTSALALVTQNTNTVATSGATQTIPDVTSDTVNAITLSASCTFTFPTAAAGKAFSLALVQSGAGSWTATWPAAVLWSGGTPPTLTTTSGKTDLFAFLCTDGTHWLGRTVGLNY